MQLWGGGGGGISLGAPLAAHIFQGLLRGPHKLRRRWKELGYEPMSSSTSLNVLMHHLAGI